MEGAQEISQVRKPDWRFPPNFPQDFQAGNLANNVVLLQNGACIRFPCTSASKFNTLRLGLFSVEAFSFGGMP